MHSQQFIDEMKQKLLAQQQKLKQDLADLHAHTEMGDEVEDNADEMAQDEANQDVIAAMKADLEKIEKALAKIEAGSYGRGVDGSEISEARLRALPWADKTI